MVDEVEVKEERGPGRPAGPRDPESHAEWMGKVEPLKLNSRHRVLICLLATGMSQKDAAVELGMSPVRISQLVTTDLFRGELEKMHKELASRFVDKETEIVTSCRKKLSEMAMPAIDQLNRLMLGAESEQVRGKMAESVLDRIGLKSVEKVDARVSVTAPEGLLDAINMRLKEAREKKVDG